MHGDIARPNEVVICKADYERYTLNHPMFHNALKADLVSKTFLFLGFSFADPNLNYMLGHLRSLLEESQREHYAIMRQVRADHKKGEEGQKSYEYEKNKQDLQIRELRRYNIRTHLVEKFSDVTNILEAIEKQSLLRNVFISGSADKFEEEFNDKRMRDFCMHLGEMLVEKDYKLISGIGLNIGDSIVKGALLKLYEQRKGAIEEHLTLRPFPRNLPPEVSQEEYFQSYRQDMISKCGFAMFIAGTSSSNPISDGVLKEYKITRELNKIPIPIGATGYAARRIWEMVKPEIEELYSGTVSSNLYDQLNDTSLNDQQILNTVFEIIKNVSDI